MFYTIGSNLCIYGSPDVFVLIDEYMLTLRYCDKYFAVGENVIIIEHTDDDQDQLGWYVTNGKIVFGNNLAEYSHFDFNLPVTYFNVLQAFIDNMLQIE